MKTYVKFLLAVIIPLSWSCADLYDTPKSELTGEQFYRNEADAIASVNSIYSVMFGTYAAAGVLFNRQLMMYEMATDDYTAGTRTRSAEVIDVSKLSHAPKNLAIDRAWQYSYNSINLANIAIEKIALIPEDRITPPVRARLINEAKFLRGWNYFNLVRWHGSVPLILWETTTLDRKTIQVEQAPEELIYEQIISDLKDAEQLPGPGEYSSLDIGRATAGAAKTLLAKVYLTQKNWTAAAQKSKEVIDSGWYALFEDFADVFKVETKNGKEHIFSSQHKGNIGFGGHRLAEVTAPVEGPFNGDNIDSPNYESDLYFSFADNDKRKNITFVTELRDPNTGILHKFSRYYFHKYWDPSTPYNQVQSSKNVPLLRYADVLLIYSEALNELGNQNEAYRYLDKVRGRAGIQHLQEAYPGLSQDQFRDSLFQERRKEFVLEYNRWFDLSRRGAAYYVNAVKAAGKQNAAPRHVRFPIPQRELDINSSLRQLPEWENY